MGEVLSGRYQISEPIGAGGSARVYRARDQRLGRDVAVKVLDDAVARSADPAARRRFENEARAGARFVHPNAVTVFDAGSDDDQLFLVTELLTGGSLAERLAASGPMEATAFARLGVQIGGALAAGHAAGLIHRDVKPSNILFTDDGVAKLADFGIARRFDEIEESLTDTGMVMGTRQYVSPEQAAGRELTGATDQFSLGVTLFEAVTGTRPASAVERPAGDVLDPIPAVPTVPSALASAISTASALPIEQRFPSMSDMVKWLTLVPGADIAEPATEVETTVPDHLRADRGPDRFGRTMALAAGAGGGRTRPTQPGSGAHVGLSSDLRAERRRTRLLVGAGAVAALLLLGFVVAATGGDGDDTATTAPASLPVATAAPATPSADLPATTITATTTEPTTISPTTGPVTTVSWSTVAQLIPGFPAPADENEFLTTLQGDPAVAGARGDDLAKRFERFLDPVPDDREREADKIRRDIEKWLDDDEIDPTIAAVAIGFLDQLAPPAGDDEGGDDDGDDD